MARGDPGERIRRYALCMSSTERTGYDTYVSPLATRNASERMVRLWSARQKFNTWRRIWLAVGDLGVRSDGWGGGV